MLSFELKYPIGIDIGSRDVHAIQLKQTKKGLAVRALTRLEFESETASISDPDQILVGAVKKMSKNRQFRGKSVTLHIPVKNISVFPIHFQVAKTETIEEAIVRESEKYLSFPLKDAVIDYPSLTPDPNGAADQYKATIIAVQRKYIEQYLGLMKQAGLTVEAVDYRISSLIRLHSHFNRVTEHPVILCNIGYTESLLTIVTQDSILAQRVIPWGAGLLFEKILANFELNKAIENARLLLKTHGLAYEDLKDSAGTNNQAPDTTAVDMGRAIFQVITPSIDDLFYEFHTMMSYVRSEQQHPGFEGIYMYGHAALIHSLDRYVEKRLNMPTKSINPLASLVQCNDNILPDISEGAPFALALGLAMRHVTWL